MNPRFRKPNTGEVALSGARSRFVPRGHWRAAAAVEDQLRTHPTK
jgi:hypothetical protein